MEYIGIGILLMIGVYLAPFVLWAVVGVTVGISWSICRLFGGCK